MAASTIQLAGLDLLAPQNLATCDVDWMKTVTELMHPLIVREPRTTHRTSVQTAIYVRAGARRRKVKDERPDNSGQSLSSSK